MPLVINCLHLLVVRASRCGRDNPGLIPGVDMCSNMRASSLVTQLVPQSHAPETGCEPPTLRLTASRSNQPSY